MSIRKKQKRKPLGKRQFSVVKAANCYLVKKSPMALCLTDQEIVDALKYIDSDPNSGKIIQVAPITRMGRVESMMVVTNQEKERRSGN